MWRGNERILFQVFSIQKITAMLSSNHNLSLCTKLITVLKPGFHYTANATTTTEKQSDHKVEQSSFTLITLFWLEIGRCRGRNWLNGNQALE